MPVGDVGNILRPSLPIATRTALLDDLGVNAVFPLFEIVEIELDLTVAVRFATSFGTIARRRNTDNLYVIRLLLV